MKMNVDIGTFDTPIGAGISGMVYTSSQYPNLVVKRITKESCIDAKREYEIASDIYEAYMQYRLCSSQDDERINICIPRVLSFQEYDTYCDILMEKIKPVILSLNGRTYNSIMHIALSDAIALKDREYGVAYNMPVNGSNPSRGFFASEDTISMIAGDVNTIVHDIGLLDGIILCAGFIPKDVEYILTRKNGRWCVAAIDFGLVQRMDEVSNPVDAYIDELDTSIYYTPVDQYRDSFIEGLREASTCIGKQCSIIENIIPAIMDL